jgi:hypothetical protein
MNGLFSYIDIRVCILRCGQTFVGRWIVHQALCESMHEFQYLSSPSMFGNTKKRSLNRQSFMQLVPIEDCSFIDSSAGTPIEFALLEWHYKGERILLFDIALSTPFELTECAAFSCKMIQGLLYSARALRR